MINQLDSFFVLEQLNKQIFEILKQVSDCHKCGALNDAEIETYKNKILSLLNPRLIVETRKAPLHGNTKFPGEGPEVYKSQWNIRCECGRRINFTRRGVKQQCYVCEARKE